MYKINPFTGKLDYYSGLTGGSINADRPINIVADGINLGDPAMGLSDFLESVIFDSYPPVINSFTGGSNLEKGESTLGYTLLFNVSAPAGGTIASIVITRSDGGASSGDIKVGTASQSGTHAITLTANTNCIFTITVTSNDGKTATDTESFLFYNRVYWGVAVPATYNEAFIKALAANALDANYAHDFTVNAGATEKIYYAVPLSMVSNPYLSPPYFFLGTALPGGMSIGENPISYTFENNTEDYILYESDNANLGATDVQVKSTPT